MTIGQRVLIGILAVAPSLTSCVTAVADPGESDGVSPGGGDPDDGGGGDPENPAGGDAGPGCVAVDLLFVIDNSPSMGEYQAALAAEFPRFVDAMYAALPVGTDLHVGVTTTSFYVGGCAESTVNCESAASSGEIAAHYVTPAEGNTEENGGQGRLFEWQGKSFFAVDTAEPSTELSAWFTGAATAAGEDGCSFEMSSAAAGYVADPANAASNAGFLRDEGAVLVVIVLSDEPDKSIEGSAAYHDMLTAAKAGCGGDACIVAAGILDQCVAGVDDTVWQFLHSFGEPPIIGDIEAPEAYAQVVGDALAAVIGQTCDDLDSDENDDDDDDIVE